MTATFAPLIVVDRAVCHACVREGPVCHCVDNGSVCHVCVDNGSVCHVRVDNGCVSHVCAACRRISTFPLIV